MSYGSKLTSFASASRMPVPWFWRTPGRERRAIAERLRPLRGLGAIFHYPDSFGKPGKGDYLGQEFDPKWFIGDYSPDDTIEIKLGDHTISIKSAKGRPAATIAPVEDIGFKEALAFLYVCKILGTEPQVPHFSANKKAHVLNRQDITRIAKNAQNFDAAARALDITINNPDLEYINNLGAALLQHYRTLKLRYPESIAASREESWEHILSRAELSAQRAFEEFTLSTLDPDTLTALGITDTVALQRIEKAKVSMFQVLESLSEDAPPQDTFDLPMGDMLVNLKIISASQAETAAWRQAMLIVIRDQIEKEGLASDTQQLKTLGIAVDDSGRPDLSKLVSGANITQLFSDLMRPEDRTSMLLAAREKVNSRFGVNSKDQEVRVPMWMDMLERMYPDQVVPVKSALLAVQLSIRTILSHHRIAKNEPDGELASRQIKAATFSKGLAIEGREAASTFPNLAFFMGLEERIASGGEITETEENQMVTRLRQVFDNIGFAADTLDQAGFNGIAGQVRGLQTRLKPTADMFKLPIFDGVNRMFKEGHRDFRLAA